LLKAHEINVAPLNEQQRIVSRIEELFSEIDEGERALERVGQLVERYRQSVLKAAVTGELTREWRARHEVESAGELLLRVGLQMRKTRSALGRRVAEPSPADVPDSPELPPNWTWATVEQLCFVETGSTPRRGEAKYYDGGTIPWVTSGAVNAARILEPTEHITAAAIAETNAKVFPAGTLIVAMYGEGKTRGKVSELGIDAATNQACAALLVDHLDPAVKAYLRLFFEKHYEELRAMAAGGVQPNLNLSIIKQTVLPLPPLAEMREICDEVDQRLSESRSVAQEVADRAPVVHALRQSILRAAFSGQLVPQDPRDEPASALLARLAAQAAEAPAAPRHRANPTARRPSHPKQGAAT
jgi:type I restriction enzyme S subunit